MGTNLLKRCWNMLPQALRPAVLRAVCLGRAERRSAAAPEPGPLFVCGAFCSTSGLGRGARLYAEAACRQGLDVVRVDITEAMRLQRNFTPAERPLSMAETTGLVNGGTAVVHANPPQFLPVLCALGKRFLHRKRVVGYWAWELEAVPPVWKQASAYVDAVEVPSTFVLNTLRSITDKPIRVLPHELPVPSRCKANHAENGVLRCLFVFDAASSLERKNPWAVLRAFARAFTPGEAELTFKVNHSRAGGRAYTAFYAACAETPGVRVLTDTLTEDELTELYLAHDVYLSLHRSEGYGLTIREALLHGLHAVATGWSGNMDFMQGERVHAVPCTLVPTRLHTGPAGGLKARWAEADIDAAADILRNLRAQLVPGAARA